MKVKNRNFKKNLLLKTIAWISILAGSLLITAVWYEISKNKKPNINLEKYRYERELEDSPCISPDGNSILKIFVVYNQPIGGNGYILGFVHFKDTNEKKWIYLQKCVLHVSVKAEVFNVYGGYEFYLKNDNIFYWKDNNVVVIDTHEIEIQNEETYYFNKDVY